MEATPAIELESSNPPSEKPRQETKPVAQRVDFRHPTFLSSGEWRTLRREVEEFVGSVGALVSTYLRLEFGLQLARLDTVDFNSFTGSLPSPTHLTLFKLEPLRGISVVEVRPGIALGIVDRLLGGPGQPASLDRNLTEMEIALLDQFVQIVLGEWCKQWATLQELRAEILGHENNARFLQSSSGDAILVVATLEARIGETLDQIQFAFPYSALEPLVQKLTQASAPTPPPAALPAPRAVKWNRGLENLPLTLTAHWPPFKIATRDLLGLKIGEVIELQPDGADKVELRIGPLTKFRCRLGAREQKRAIQIIEICKS